MEMEARWNVYMLSTELNHRFCLTKHTQLLTTIPRCAQTKPWVKRISKDSGLIEAVFLQKMRSKWEKLLFTVYEGLKVLIRSIVHFEQTPTRNYLASLAL